MNKSVRNLLSSIALISYFTVAMMLSSCTTEQQTQKSSTVNEEREKVEIPRTYFNLILTDTINPSTYKLVSQNLRDNIDVYSFDLTGDYPDYVHDKVGIVIYENKLGAITFYIEGNDNFEKFKDSLNSFFDVVDYEKHTKQESSDSSVIKTFNLEDDKSTIEIKAFSFDISDSNGQWTYSVTISDKSILNMAESAKLDNRQTKVILPKKEDVFELGTKFVNNKKRYDDLDDEGIKLEGYTKYFIKNNGRWFTVKVDNSGYIIEIDWDIEIDEDVISPMREEIIQKYGDYITSISANDEVDVTIEDNETEMVFMQYDANSISITLSIKEEYLHNLEKRKVEIEKKAKELIPSKSSQVASQHSESASIQNEPGAKEIISVKLSNKRFSKQNYQDYIWFDIEFKAIGLDKPARAIKGALNLQDLFGEVILKINWTIDKPINPGKTVSEKGTGFEYNQFRSAHSWAKNTDLSNMTASFTVTNILYIDGTRMDF